jgi:hypothetical protein
MEWTHRKATLALSILTMLGAPPVWAVLGGQESSVSLDLQVLHGTDREEAHQGYKFHQITVPDGTVVKEFVSPAGLVFGISWQAPHMPNLQQLLGSNMAELQAAVAARTHRNSGGPLIVRTDRLVFVSGGHMRAFHGYAYVPGLVPSNVSPEVVQ